MRAIGCKYCNKYEPLVYINKENERGEVIECTTAIVHKFLSYEVIAGEFYTDGRTKINYCPYVWEELKVEIKMRFFMTAVSEYKALIIARDVKEALEAYSMLVADDVAEFEEVDGYGVIYQATANAKLDSHDFEGLKQDIIQAEKTKEAALLLVDVSLV